MCLAWLRARAQEKDRNNQCMRSWARPLPKRAKPSGSAEPEDPLLVGEGPGAVEEMGDEEEWNNILFDDDAAKDEHHNEDVDNMVIEENIETAEAETAAACSSSSSSSSSSRSSSSSTTPASSSSGSEAEEIQENDDNLEAGQAEAQVHDDEAAAVAPRGALGELQKFDVDLGQFRYKWQDESLYVHCNRHPGCRKAAQLVQVGEQVKEDPLGF